MGGLTRLEGCAPRPICGGLRSLDRFQRGGGSNRDLVGRFLCVDGCHEGQFGDLLGGMGGNGVPPRRPPICQ